MFSQRGFLILGGAEWQYGKSVTQGGCEKMIESLSDS